MMKKRNFMHRFIWLVIALICVLFAIGCEGVLFPLPYRSLAPFEGKVVDADTKQPVEEAVVLGIYYFESYSIAGTSSHLKDGQEVMTDRNGEFKLPRTRRWFVLNRGYPEGKLVIFKPGYGVFPDHRKSQAVGENKGWPPPGKYIVYELPRLRTKAERKKNVRSASRYSEIPYKNIRQYWEKVNQECVNVDIPPMTMTEEERQR
ncbi:MAG TPA: hypothetical protein EYP35_08220 [Desulfobacterales bacterium]|nr:hypothetical protein [Desulfobacterales bacterium]